MKIPLDIETIPSQTPGNRESYITDTKENFKAPSSLTKTQAALDLGIRDPKLIKFTSKDQMIDDWVFRFRASKALEVADELWRKTALNALKGGEVISIAAIANKQLFSEYRRLGDSERSLIECFFDFVREQCSYKQHQSEAFFIGHNIPFDIKFLFQRAVILNIEPAFNLNFNGHHGRHFFDNSHAVCSHGDRISQNDLASALGIELKPDDIDGSKVWDFVQAGNEKRVNEYNEYDVNTVVKIYNRLTFNRDMLWHAA